MKNSFYVEFCIKKIGTQMARKFVDLSTSLMRSIKKYAFDNPGLIITYLSSDQF